MTRTDNF